MNIVITQAILNQFPWMVSDGFAVGDQYTPLSFQIYILSMVQWLYNCPTVDRSDRPVKPPKA